MLLGIITIDDIVHVLQEEHHEDMLLISGVEGTERIGGPFKESIQKRTPWLFNQLNYSLYGKCGCRIIPRHD